MDIAEIDFNNNAEIVRIATGQNHVLALDARGSVYSWGSNEKCQLGYPLTEDVSDQNLPKKINKLKGIKICQIYCGDYSSFAIDEYGDIYGWGLNKNNCLFLN